MKGIGKGLSSFQDLGCRQKEEDEVKTAWSSALCILISDGNANEETGLLKNR